jgi:GT2 family glycosyltransferase
VVVPTLAADSALAACLDALERQTLGDFDVFVVDNSGAGLVRQRHPARPGVTVLENEHNVGFGAAINAAFGRSKAPFLATLNDDAVADPGWLEALVGAMESETAAGMCASRVLLAGSERLDSAGMLVACDGSSKQRGHGQAPEVFSRREEALLPSASAALYRRAMLEEIGPFDEDFFLYCEDTDLGLRARWAGWKCLYVPDAVVEHRYSYSAGRASPLKAYYVERNRLFVIVKNFPGCLLAKAPWASLVRYAWHLVSLFTGAGAAARFRESGHAGMRLPWLVLRAHLSALRVLPRLLRKRRAIRRTARLSSAQFGALLRAHSIGLREVAAL